MNTNVSRERTRELLITHCQSFPGLQIQDLCKYLYQSAFGCEHMISSPEAVTEGIEKEFQNCVHTDNTEIIKLDGPYSRIPLSCLGTGLSAATFGKLFYYSAQKRPDGHWDLLSKIEIARELLGEGLLPFSQNDFESEIASWEAKGYPAVHHSAAFKELYHPSYRLMADEYVLLLPFLTELDKRMKKQNTIVAIDGRSASGKTTLSRLLEKIYDCTVFHMDDFFLQPHQRTSQRLAEVGGNFDRERFLEEVLLPLTAGKTVRYKRFDCSTISLKKEKLITPKPPVIIEGVYSMHPELSKYYDLSLFLDISPEVQRKRILRRNSPQMAERFFTTWIPMENRYFEETGVPKRCDMRLTVTE